MNKTKTILNQLGKDFFVEEYLNKKKSCGIIAKELGVSQTSIIPWLRKYNIQRRNSSESQLLVRRTINNCVCKICGKEFHVGPHQIKRGRGIFCSVECMYKGNSRSLKNGEHPSSRYKFTKEDTVGIKNGNYKDGRTELRIYSIARNAHRRGYEYSLSIEDVKEYWQKPCFYCGSSMETIGLDRVDNTRGYTKDNIVSCCWDCNRIKMTMTQEGFFEKIIQIYNYNKLWEKDEKQISGEESHSC
jgi:hypothetical protein